GILGKAARRGSSSVLTGPRRMAFTRLASEGQAAVRQAGRFGSLIADLSASFVGMPVNCIDAAIEGGLRQTVEALGVDHSAYYQSTGNGLMVTHSWPPQDFEANSAGKQA